MNRDTVRRMLDTMLAIPRWPRTKTTAEIAQHLANQGHRVHRRSVQRDLLRLEKEFGFRCSEEGRTYRWFYPADRKVIDLPAMDAPAALAFLLSREYLKPLLPPSTLKLLAPYFGRAEEAFREVPGSLAVWRERICVVQRGPQLRPPKVDPLVQSEVYEAVLGGHQLEIEYQRRGADSGKSQVVHPQGLIVYEGVVYLAAATMEYKQAVTYALQRVRSAKRLDQRARRLEGFDLNAFAHKELRFPISEKAIHLVAKFDSFVAQHLRERPLSEDQSVEVDGECTTISATTHNTEQLRWWLMGFGEHVEVLKPKALRDAMRQQVLAMVKHYS